MSEVFSFFFVLSVFPWKQTMAVGLRTYRWSTTRARRWHRRHKNAGHIYQNTFWIRHFFLINLPRLYEFETQKLEIMAATSDEQMNLLLSSFDQIYEVILSSYLFFFFFARSSIILVSFLDRRNLNLSSIEFDYDYLVIWNQIDSISFSNRTDWKRDLEISEIIWYSEVSGLLVLQNPYRFRIDFSQIFEGLDC